MVPRVLESAAVAVVLPVVDLKIHHMPTKSALLCRGKVSADLDDSRPMFNGNVLEYLHELRVCKIADLPSPVPVHLHRLDVQVFYTDYREPAAELVRELEEPVPALTLDPPHQPLLLRNSLPVAIGPLLVRLPPSS